MKTAVEWVAEIKPVREVSLLGDADLAFWTEQLQPEGLIPIPHAARAQVLLIAAEMRFWGILFQELSFSILVRDPAEPASSDGPPADASFLVQAFSSNSFFAYCERAFFSTPYEYGDVRVDANLPVAMRLMSGRETIFEAEMGAKTDHLRRTALRRGEEGWYGPVFLPRLRSETAEQAGVFIAKLSGVTEVFPFASGDDELTIKPAREAAVLQMLLDSRFTPREWIIRQTALHAKSKTYRRSEQPGR